MPELVRVSVVIERKYPNLPRFLVFPGAAIAAWKLPVATTTVTGSLNGHEFGRRSIKPWDRTGARWFMELPQPLCEKAGIETGDRVELEMRVASEELPAELAELLASDALAKKAWERLSASSRRMVREHVAAAKQTETRARRAEAAVARMKE